MVAEGIVWYDTRREDTMGMQVARWLRSFARRDPRRIAVVLEGEVRPCVTFEELDARACRVAGALVARGLRTGDHVALLAANNLDFVAGFYGALYLGLVVLPIPTASTAEATRARLVQARVRLVLVDEAHRTLAVAATDGTGIGRVETAALVEEGHAIEGPLDLPAEADAMLLFTSGTTSTPKAACITHASLVAHTSACVHHALALGPSDVVLGALPLTHSYGLRMALLAPLYAGARVVLLRRFESDAVARALSEAGITWFPGVPTMFSALARDGRTYHAPRLRSCLSAGAALAPALRLRAEAALGVKVREGYGLTEATFTTLPSWDDEDPDAADTVGRPVPGVEVAILDDEGHALPHGARGEIVVRGQNVMRGYLDDPAATSEAIRAGWLHTGDVGELDAHGRLRILDRKKDLIVRGGFNVVPVEVERAVVEHADVADALVVGVPDEHYGEEIVAVVVARAPGRLDRASLAAHLHERLSPAQRPRLLAVVDALPIGASGKALRRELRARLADGRLVVEPLR